VRNSENRGTAAIADGDSSARLRRAIRRKFEHQQHQRVKSGIGTESAPTRSQAAHLRARCVPADKYEKATQAVLEQAEVLLPA
jgi:hypothetical protein